MNPSHFLQNIVPLFPGDRAMSDDPITLWLTRLKANDERAVEAIWNQYFHKLVQLSRNRLGSLPRRVDDEEDIALSAMNSFFRAAQRGRFPRLDDRDDLWRILVTITARKISRRHRRYMTAKRGAGEVRGDSAIMNAYEGADIAAVMGTEPSPELAAETAETCRELMGLLDDESLTEIVLLKLEGYTNQEIGETLECATRTVERKLQRVRKLWGSQISE